MTHEVSRFNPGCHGYSFWIATGIFLIVYGLIVTEKIHKTILAIFGAAIMIVLRIVDTGRRISIQWN